MGDGKEKIDCLLLPAVCPLGLEVPSTAHTQMRAWRMRNHQIPRTVVSERIKPVSNTWTPV